LCAQWADDDPAAAAVHTTRRTLLAAAHAFSTTRGGGGGKPLVRRPLHRPTPREARTGDEKVVGATRRHTARITR